MVHVARGANPAAPPEIATATMSAQPSTQTELEAYAFRQLVAHLQSRPDVQNIDQMNLAGFCRNCLSKWYLRGARERGVLMNYDEALEAVYGEPYGDWKAKHQQNATQEQMASFEANAHLHAKHPKMDDLQTRNETRHHSPMTPAGVSDVCCTPADGIAAESLAKSDATANAAAATLGAVGDAASVRLGVLTISDRAHAGAYPDLSGPAIIETCAEHFDVFSTLSYIVPDDERLIQARLKQLTASGCNLVFTTGGTGVSPRDVTPEATLKVVHRRIPGIAQLLLNVSLKNEPHACLSRGVAGVRDRALIINLPGRPNACRELVAAVAAVVPHALRQIARGE